MEEQIYEEWIPSGDTVSKVLEYDDESCFYEQDTTVLFLTEKGQYVVVESMGCSCWDPTQDTTWVYTNEQDARAKYFELRKGE